MITLLPYISYLAVMLCSWRVFGGSIAWYMGEEAKKKRVAKKPDTSFGFWLGLVGAVVWPLIWSIILYRSVCHNMPAWLRPRWPTMLMLKGEREAHAHNRQIEHARRAKELQMPIS